MRALWLTGLLLLAPAAGAQPQPTDTQEAEERPPANALSTAPAGLLFGQVGLEYERALWPAFSLVGAAQLQLGFGLPSLLTGLLTTGATEADVSGGGGLVGARWYLLGGRLGRGLFAGPELAVQHLSLTGRAGRAQGEASFTAASLTGLVGASLSPPGGGPLVSVGAGLSVGYLWLAARAGELPARASTPWALPALRLNVGWAF